MKEGDIVRTIKIQSQTEGVAQSAAAVKGLKTELADLGNTAAVVATKTEVAAKRQLSAADAFGRIERQLNAAAKAQYDYERIVTKVNAAVAQNSSLADRGAAVISLAEERLKRATQATGESTRAVGLNAAGWQNLSYQINDVVSGLASGQSPFMILTQQGGQLQQILASGQGGVSGSLKSIGTYLGSLLTVGRIAFGGIVAGATAAAFATNSYLEAQRKVAMGVLGAGRASGATSTSINQIAEQGASPFGLSISEARELATALAQTGKIANDNLLPILQIGKDISRIYGIDATDAAKMLADAFADPAKGADQLNGRLGFLDAASKKNIENLVAQNNMYGAQRALLAGVQQGLQGVSEATSTTASGWVALGNAISNGWDALGKFIAKAAGLDDGLEEQLAKAKAKLNELKGNGGYFTGIGFDLPVRLDQSAIDAQQKRVDDLTAAIDRNRNAAGLAASAQKSFLEQSTVRNLTPQIAQQESLNNQLKVLEDLMKSLSDDEGASARLKQLGLTFEQISAAINILRTNIAGFKSDFDKALESAKLAGQAITAFSPGQKGEIARQQSLLATSSSNYTDDQRKALAEQAYSNAVKEATTALSEQARSRELAANQAVASAQLEVDLVGKSIGQQAVLRANLQARQQLEQQASQTHTAVNEAEYNRLAAINAKLAELKQSEAERAALSKAQFDFETAGWSDVEKAIAAANYQLYGDQWKDHANDRVADLKRLTDAAEQLSQATTQFGKDMLSAFMRGDSALKSMTSAASNLISTLASKNLERFLNGGSVFGSGDLMSGQGALAIGSAGLSGYQSGNWMTGALGGALAGASFGPVGAAIGGVAGALGGLLGASKKADEELKQNQERWKAMAGQVTAFNRAAEGFELGPLTQELESLRQTHDTLAMAALQAKDYAGLNQVHETLNKGIRRVFSEWMNGVPVLGDLSQKIQDVTNEARGLTEVIPEAAAAIQDGLIARINALKMAAEDALKSEIYEAQGFGWLNDINAAIAKFNDLSGKVDPNLLNTWFSVTLQKIVDGAELTGEAFQRLVTGIPQIAGYVHEFDAALQDVANAVKRTADEIASVRQSFQDQLFTLRQDQNTLAGALAVFDLQAQRQREAEIKAGGEALADLEALQAQQRYNIIKDFNDKAIADQQRAAEEQKRALEEAQQAFNGFVKNIRDYIAHYLASPESLLSPAEQLANAQSAYNSQLALAQSGNRDALNSITQYFDDLQKAAKGFYASSEAGQSIISTALGQLDALPSQISPEQFIVNAINAQTTELVDTMDVLRAAVLTGDATTIATALVPHFNALLNPTTGLLNQAQLESKLNFPNGALDKIFKELDGNGDGILEKSELIKTATQGVKVGTDNLPTVKTNTDTLPVQATRIAGMDTSLLAMAQVSNNTASTANQLATLNNAMTVGGVAAGEALRAMRLMMVEQNVRQGIPAYAMGTDFHPGGLALVGEKGPEIVEMPVGARVIPNHIAFSNDNGNYSELLEAVEALRAEVRRNTQVAASGHQGQIEAAQEGNQALRKMADKQRLAAARGKAA